MTRVERHKWKVRQISHKMGKRTNHKVNGKISILSSVRVYLQDDITVFHTVYTLKEALKKFCDFGLPKQGIVAYRFF